MNVALLKAPGKPKPKPEPIEDDGTTIGGKTVEQWDKLWKDEPDGFVVPHPELRGKAGLFRALLNGETMVIGMASERRGGRLSKRLSDFTRPGNSGRKHKSGTYIHDNAASLTLQVLVTGSDYAACEVAPKLRKAMIKLHAPLINVPPKIVRKAAFG